MKNFFQQNFVLFLLILFFLFGSFGIVHHEIFRDEAQVWLLARDSSSIHELLYNKRYETHPPLWYLLIYFISKLTSSPISMQWTHLLIASLTVWIFIKYAPFSKIQKLLFIFGYFPFYEYAIKSRCYSLGFLFIYIFCALLREKNRNYLLLYFLLFLSSQANFISAIISVCLGLYLLIEVFEKRRGNLYKNSRFDIFPVLTLSFLMIFILKREAVFYPGTYADFFDEGGWRFWFDWRLLFVTLNHISEAYLFPTKILNASNININFIISFILIIYMSLAFLRRPKILIVYTLGTLSILSFSYVNPLISLWHIGHLYILLIICLWISNYCSTIEFKANFLNKLAYFIEKHLNKVLFLILLANFISGVYFTVLDWKYPYSAGKDASHFIRRNNLENLPIIGDIDYSVMPLAAYLNKKIFYPTEGKFSSFVLANEKNEKARHPKCKLIIQEAEKLAKKNKSDILIALNYKLYMTENHSKIKELEHFTGNLVEDENLYLYKLIYTKK